jgi:Putative prokaryotic signal transducing protein
MAKDPGDDSMDRGRRVEVARFPDDLTAQLVVSRLRAEGIEATLISDDAGSTYPMLQMVHGVRVLVPEEDEAAALEILEEAEEYEVVADGEDGEEDEPG